jgi:hypothetical protein
VPFVTLFPPLQWRFCARFYLTGALFCDELGSTRNVSAVQVVPPALSRTSSPDACFVLLLLLHHRYRGESPVHLEEGIVLAGSERVGAGDLWQRVGAGHKAVRNSSIFICVSWQVSSVL